MVWTPELVEQLRQQWALGLSITQIGKNLGLTRNAVVGKAHRIGLTKRESPINKANMQPRRQAEPAAARALREAVAVAPTPVVVAPVKADPNYRGPKCKWPVGDPKSTEFHFCEAPALEPYPYCSAHCAMAYSTWNATQAKAANAA